MLMVSMCAVDIDVLQRTLTEYEQQQAQAPSVPVTPLCESIANTVTVQPASPAVVLRLWRATAIRAALAQPMDFLAEQKAMIMHVIQMTPE
ncbi:uncharacterized protein ARMOST_21969 [Armillaria ostoyae]|uniref:Uncharacterized protein n=1 Tax=Armillaria ostoyae TaxID=47428 RepID=A0A284SBJ0_ARMOS|nr:uncharacterized protein ARMOST_21969 [Armillaria ostoyae]